MVALVDMRAEPVFNQVDPLGQRYLLGRLLFYLDNLTYPGRRTILHVRHA